MSVTLHSTQAPLILIDASSYLYRAFHALPSLTNSKQEPTGAIYGVINMLRRLLLDYTPEYVAVVFDAKGKTFRDELYPAYKANRESMPNELRQQIEPLYAIIRAMGLPLLVVDGVEADDVIGTLARQASLKGRHTLISTGDKDLAQLVCAEVTLLNTMTNTLLDVEGVRQKFGVMPDQIIDYLTLMGDTSDNIPGVPGVGAKTAAKWLQEWGTLDRLLQHADEIKGKIGENLRAHRSQILLSRALVTIKQDVAMKTVFEELRVLEKDTTQLIALFKQLEFKSWLNELLKTTPSDKPTVSSKKEVNYQTISTQAELNEWIARLESANYFAFDTETTSLDTMVADIVGVSFAIQEGQAAYLPLSHDYADAPLQLNRDAALSQLKPLLENPNKKKLGHHIKYDQNVLANYGIDLQGIVYDSMIESYVVDSMSRHDMDTLALKYLGYKTISFEEVAGKGAKQKTFNQISIDIATQYAAEDADITLQLHHVLWEKIEKEPGLKNVYTEIEIPLISVLSRMERTGVLIDTAMLKEQSKALAKRVAVLEKEVHVLAESVFNLNSPKQLQIILYEKLGLPILQKTPTGQPSTAEPVLQELAISYRLPQLILEYRSLSKLKSTYTDRLPEQMDPRTGRVHTSYLQAVTATGRLASSDPNLQNIPIRTEEGRKIRQAFIAKKGYQLIAADYSQIELRIMAHFSQDPGLLAAFAQNLDIHAATASEIFGVALDAVTPDQRRSAKAINFGLIYGMSSFGLARQLNIDRYAAQQYMDQYFERYPGVKTYMENTRRSAREKGYVETLFGRRLYLPEIQSRHQQRQKAAERAAINAPLQGTAADIIKLAMIKVDHYLSSADVDACMIMQVHDELVLEVATEDIQTVATALNTAMSEAASLAVPLVVDVGIGHNWDEAH